MSFKQSDFFCFFFVGKPNFQSHIVAFVTSIVFPYYLLYCASNGSKHMPWNLRSLLLTHSMEQSPTWEANRFSASQEIPRILWNSKVIIDGFIIVIVTVIVIVISGLEADRSPSSAAEFKYQCIYTFSYSCLLSWPKLYTNIYNNIIIIIIIVSGIIIIIIIICIRLFIYGIGAFRFNKQRDLTTESKVSILSWYMFQNKALSLHPKDECAFLACALARARVCERSVQCS